MPDELDRPILAEFGRGRCINCGFLSKKDKANHDEDMHRVSVGERRSGQIRGRKIAHSVGSGLTEITNFAPFCSKRIISMVQLAEALPGFQETEQGEYHVWEGLSPLFGEDRHCPLWWPYREDLSPKEHLEEYRMRLLEDERRDYEAKTERSRRRFELILFGVAITAAIAQVVIAIIAIFVGPGVNIIVH
jgi:ribosomal protein S6E (S10)